jgi:uncharacterized membrane protein
MDDPRSALGILLRYLKIDITDTSLKRIDLRKDLDNMQSLSMALEEYYVDTLVVKLQAYQLKEIPYPAIAHLNKNNGHFVVLLKLEQETIYYVDPEIGNVKESIGDFEKKWTGVILLAETNEKSGEEGYKEKRKHELFLLWSNRIAWCLLCSLLITQTFFVSSEVLPYYFAKIVGFTFCFALLQKQFGTSNKSIDAFCKMGAKSNCDAVIHSPASRLFGIIHLSELGLLYFVGGLLSLIIAAFAHSAIPLPISILSLVAFPFIIGSIYYQWRIVKAWCPLCLLVMLVILLEVLCLYVWGDSFAFSLQSTFISLLGFALPLLFWLSVRQRFIDSHQVPALERNLTKFTRSERIFQTLLSNQQTIEMIPFSHELTAGNAEAPITITIVSSPTCGPCSYAHAVMENLLHQFDGKIKANFRFTVNMNDLNSISNQMIKHALALSKVDKDKCLKALSDWYFSSNKVDINKWKHEHPIENLNGRSQALENLLNEHATWSIEAGISATPTLFINGKRYPEEYSLTDLKFQIKKLLEIMPVPEPVS